MSAPAIPPVAGPGPRPLVSVVTAAYQAEAGLRETVASVAAQSFADREHIVVDGGSTDGTRAFLESLGPAVRWVSEPDGGIADAMNKGVRMARGHWILVLHAADVFEGGGALARAAMRLAEPGPGAGIDLLACDVRLVGPGRARLASAGKPARRLRFKPVCHQGALCRRALFERVGGFDDRFRICMDYDFMARALRSGARFAHAPLVLARMDDAGISSRTDWPSLARRFAEERRVQLAHCPGPAMRAVYALYWPPYLAYRRLRAALSGARG